MTIPEHLQELYGAYMASVEEAMVSIEVLKRARDAYDAAQRREHAADRAAKEARQVLMEAIEKHAVDVASDAE